MPLRHLAVLLALLLLAAAVGPAAAMAAEPPPEDTAPPAETAPQAAPKPAESAKRGKRTAKDLPPRYREWLEEVEVLITPQERETFLSLEQEHQLEAFIDRFWEVRDPYPDTARNEFRDQWELRVSEARAEFGNLVEDRARHLLLNGLPPNRIRSNCSQLLWPLEVWIYPPSERVREVLVLVFVQQWGVGRPRLWQPFDGLAAIVQAPALSRVSSDVLSQVAMVCPNGDQIAGAIAHVLRMGSVEYSTLLQAVERSGTGESREWVATFHAGSTDLPAGAESMPAELVVGYPGRRQTRTLVQASLLVPRAAAGRAELGGHASYNFLLNGEILLGRRRFDAFRYKFDLPADRAPERIPLTFERLLRPGLEGIRVLKEKGGRALAQSDATCVVYGMPKAIVDAGLADAARRGHHLDADAAVGVGFGNLAEIDVDAGQRQRVAHRDEVRRTLGGHHRGDVGNGQHVALGDLAGADARQRRRLQAQDAAGDRHALRLGLGRHVDHARAAGVGEVGQVIRFSQRGHPPMYDISIFRSGYVFSFVAAWRICE